MNETHEEGKGFTSITQANNWYLRVKNGEDSSIYPVAVWASEGNKVKGLVSLFKGDSPALFTPPPGAVSQYVHGDQLTDIEKQIVKREYRF
ncbi:hypothetical protein [Serratia quinivorans]|uniref:hypothetical protein n=1 Tax=Serratia quinivorans TaxID=137545 RepID=UPI003F9E8569